MKLNFLLAASVVSLVCTSPAAAETITYTLSGTFSGLLAGNNVTDYAATFTGVGDTATRVFMQDANFVTLSSLTLKGSDGQLFTLTDPYQIFSSPNFGSAGFKTVAGVDKFAFNGPALFGYDNKSNLSPSPVSQYFSAPFQTDKGSTNFTSSNGLTFAAMVSPVPEPSTWALSILGFGLVGGAIRRRAKVRTTIRFA